MSTKQESKAKKPASKSSSKKPPTERRSRFSTPVDEEAMEFIRAIEAFKERKRRSFPSWTEVLRIFKSLGYRKVGEPDEKSP